MKQTFKLPDGMDIQEFNIWYMENLLNLTRIPAYILLTDNEIYNLSADMCLGVVIDYIEWVLRNNINKGDK